NVLNRVARRHAIAVIISDFLFEQSGPATPGSARSRGAFLVSPTLGPKSLSALRQANRRHDVIAIQVVDRFELELPALGRLIFKDAETGEVIEVNTNDPRRREGFSERRTKHQAELGRLFRSANIDSIEVRTDQPYAAALGKF